MEDQNKSVKRAEFYIVNPNQTKIIMIGFDNFRIRDNTEKYKRYNFWVGVLTVVLILGFGFTACDAPAGPEGPQGPEGPVGPAGEDGSMIYSDEGGPGEDVGDLGDYYLNQNTGELYGPKEDDGWGEPIIVLMGEEGEDGSQIHSGSGAPDASLGTEGDYYLDEDSYDLYGPKTSNGWGSPLNLKGADGNANVTRYIFSGHDFSSDGAAIISVGGVESESEMQQSVWQVYLVYDNEVQDRLFYYSMPGVGQAGSSTYRSYNHYDDSSGETRIDIYLEDGTGEEYVQIEIIRIESSETVDNRKQKGDDIIPNHLDVSDYEEVARYYGFWQ